MYRLRRFLWKRNLFFIIIISVIKFFSVVTLVGCMNYKTINLQDHVFDGRPPHMIWFMVPGLDEEHLGLLKTGDHSLREESFFERSLCFGKFWNFNLFELRPKASLGLLSQVTGSKNIPNSCDGHGRETIWDVFHAVGYKTIILESAVNDEDSFAVSKTCGHNDFLAPALLVRMHDGEGEEFHFQQKADLTEGRILYDKSCQKSTCFSSFSDNAKSLWGQLDPGNNTLLVFRIEDYKRALKSRNMARVVEVLTEIVSLIEFFKREAPSPLILVTSSEAQKIEFPGKGKGQGGVLYKRSSLLSPVWAQGPGAENFCGIYSESDIYNRILWRPRRGFLEEKIRRQL